MRPIAALQAEVGQAASAGSRKDVYICAAAGFTTLLDSAVLSIGVPAIRSSLDAGTSEVQWILASYSLTFGLALVPAGRLGDVIGRRPAVVASAQRAVRCGHAGGRQHLAP